MAGLPAVSPNRWLLLVVGGVGVRLLLVRLVVSWVWVRLCLWWWLLLLHRGLCAACHAARRSGWPLRCCTPCVG